MVVEYGRLRGHYGGAFCGVVWSMVVDVLFEAYRRPETRSGPGAILGNWVPGPVVACSRPAHSFCPIAYWAGPESRRYSAVMSQEPLESCLTSC